jgi:hypothetical protein
MARSIAADSAIKVWCNPKGSLIVGGGGVSEGGSDEASNTGQTHTSFFDNSNDVWDRTLGAASFELSLPDWAMSIPN